MIVKVRVKVRVSIGVMLLLVLLLGMQQGWLSNRGEIETASEGIVPYQHCFEMYAGSLGWDWELLAAVAWHESHFNPRAQSYAGAKGVMQMMPRTAKRFGLNDTTVWVPEENIRAGVEYIQFLQGKWSFITNKDEQNKFVLASYNVGPGFIFQARRVVREEGGNPYVWAQVEPYVQQEATKKYVKQVLRTANKYRHDYSEWQRNSATD